MNRATKPPAVNMVLALVCCVAGGCASGRHARAPEPVAPAPPVASNQVAVATSTAVPTVEVAREGVAVTTTYETPAPTPVAQPARPAQPAPAPQTAAPKAPAKAPVAVPAATPKPSPKPAAAAVTAPTPAPQVVPKVAAAPVSSPAPTATLDFKSLESRLRQTQAIGMLTKLSLKNQIDDLLDGLRAYHKRQGTAKLADLRRSYDMLVLKVLSLLQDNDAALARDIVKSRTAIWSILEDSRKFSEANLMAGVTP